MPNLALIETKRITVSHSWKSVSAFLTFLSNLTSWLLYRATRLSISQDSCQPLGSICRRSQRPINPHINTQLTHLPTISVEPSVNPSNGPICQPFQWTHLSTRSVTPPVSTLSDLNWLTSQALSVDIFSGRIFSLPLYPFIGPSVNSLRGLISQVTQGGPVCQLSIY